MEKQPKLLFVTDDIRFPSGVGIQAYKLLKGLEKTGNYSIASIAGSLIPTSTEPSTFEGIKLYPTSNGYGDPNIFKTVLQIEKPDIIIFFSDPRFFTWAFTIDNEYRHASKVIFYHTWDNDPFPKFNNVWYSACDKIVLLSRFSYNLMTSGGVDCECIPHGGDPTEFFPLPDKEKEEIRHNMFKNLPFKPDMVFFYNNRNIARKRTSDVVLSFRRFFEKHPKSLLLMNTSAIDRDGNDLGMVIRHVETNNGPIIINQSKISSVDLNKFYNIADATINIAINEGFGLSCMESLLAGTPGITVRTGGLTEQMTDGNQIFGELITPAARSLYGIPGNPYIFQDWASLDDIQNAMESAYNKHMKIDQDGISDWKKLGLAGREYIIKNNNIKNTVSAWDNLLKAVLDTPSKFERFKLHTL